MKKLLGLHGGIFRYLIEHIDHAVVTGHDPFIMYRNKYVMFNIQVLGLQSVPNYFKEFLVKESDYVKAQMALPSHAGEAAIIAALHEGQSSFYQAELQKLVAAAKAKQVAYDAVCEKAALDAMSKQETVATVDKIKAEDPMKAISPISTTALAACQKARGPRPRMPSMRVLQKKAREAASQMVRAHAVKANAENIKKNGRAVATQPPVSQDPEYPIVYDDEDYLTGGYDDPSV